MAFNHPYKTGYSVLPQLRRIVLSDVFQVSAEELSEAKQFKRDAMRSQTWLVERDCPQALQDSVLEFLKQHYPLPLPSVAALEELLPEIAEDLILHCRDDRRDWMAFGGVFFPSGWWPEQKVGKSFREIHEPVAGMNLANSDALVETMISSGPFERFVWSPVFSAQLNGHPSRPKARFESAHPQLWIKVERQVTVGFPEHFAALFLLKQSLITESEIDKAALRKALLGMTAEQRVYKGIAEDFGELVDWLSSA